LTVTIGLVDESADFESCPLASSPTPFDPLFHLFGPPPALFTTRLPPNSLRSTDSKVGQSPPPSPSCPGSPPPGNRLRLAPLQITTLPSQLPPPHPSPLIFYPWTTPGRVLSFLARRRHWPIPRYRHRPTIPTHCTFPLLLKTPGRPTPPPIPLCPVFHSQDNFSASGFLLMTAQAPRQPIDHGRTLPAPNPDLPRRFTHRSSPPLTRYGKTPTGRLPEAYGRAPDHAGLHHFLSWPLPTLSSSHLHQPHPPTHHLTTSHPSKNPPHHKTRPSTTSRCGLCGTAVHTPANALCSRWTPPPTWSLGPRWIPPPTQPPPPSPPPTPPTGLPLLHFVVDLTRPIYRKVFLSPGTKGFPLDRTWFITKPCLPSSHTFSHDSGYVAYSGPPPAFGTTPPNPETVPGGNP